MTMSAQEEIDAFAAANVALARRASIIGQAHRTASAGRMLVDGEPVFQCACGHQAHATPCLFGVSDGDGEHDCGCPRTCTRCLNLGFIIVRSCRGDGDDEEMRDCPRGCPSWHDR